MMRMTRRSFLASLGAVALAGCGLKTDRQLSVASHVWPAYELMFLAKSEGWLDGTLVSLLETNSASDSLQALEQGRVAGAALTLDEVLSARSRGIPLAVVMVFDISLGADMLIARAGIDKLSDLKGRLIGVEQDAVGGLMLANLLRVAGLDKHDVRLLPLTIDRQFDVWMQNGMDAVVTYEPVASKLLARGGIKLFDSRQIPNTIVDVLAIRGDRLDGAHQAAVRNLLAGYFQALNHFNHNPYDAAFRMAERLRLPADGVLSAYKGLLLPDADSNHRLLTGNPPELLGTARRVASFMVESGLLPKNSSLDGLLRPEFLPPLTER